MSDAMLTVTRGEGVLNRQGDALGPFSSGSIKADLISYFGDFHLKISFFVFYKTLYNCSTTVNSSRIRRCLKYSRLLHDTFVQYSVPVVHTRYYVPTMPNTRPSRYYTRTRTSSFVEYLDHEDEVLQLLTMHPFVDLGRATGFVPWT